MREPLLYRITRPIIKYGFRIIFRPTYIGLENIKGEARCVLVGNHTSNLDCLLLISSTQRTIHFLAKDSLMKGWKRIIFQNMGIIPVNRNIHDKKALSCAIECLNKDQVIGIFPEGTINQTDDIIMPFKIGAVKMAQATNSSLVPFTIKNQYKIFRKSVVIEFYPSYKIKTKKEDLTEENQKLMNIISSELRK